MFESYEALPDYMDVNTLKSTFKQFLYLVHTSPNLDVIDALEGLLQLAERQWHTYERLEEQLRKEIDNWTLSVWDTSDINVVELITCIVGPLGLKDTFDKITESLNQELSPDARKEIVQCIAEIKDGINDPYISLKDTGKEPKSN